MTVMLNSHRTPYIDLLKAVGRSSRRTSVWTRPLVMSQLEDGFERG